MDMEIVNQILRIVTEAVVSIFGILILAYLPKIKNIVIDFINEHTDEKQRKIALEIAKVIEEEARLGELIETKVNRFEELILEKIPTLTQEDIDYLRNLAVKTLNESNN